MGPPLIECDLPLTPPGLVAHNELVLSGWAASPQGVSGVAVQIGERQWNASYGLDTPAVARSLPGIDGSGQAGFRLVVDTSTWEPGHHHVTVAAFDNEGGRAAVEGPVEIRPFARTAAEPPDSLAALEREEVTLALDSPTIVDGACEAQSPLEISGWSYAKAGVEAVLVTLDGRVQYDALRPIVRPDLLHVLGPELAAEAGFALRLDPIDCPPGEHSLVVSVLSRDGRTAAVEASVLCRPAPEATPSFESPATIEWASDPVTQRRRPEQPEAPDAERMWESRALTAEADAALSRAEARIAVSAQERARRELRAAENDAGAMLGRLSSELAAARRNLATLRSEFDGDREAARLEAVARYERSLSWRVTRSLRWVKSSWLRRIRRT